VGWDVCATDVDFRRRRLLVIRDRFGIKPLFYRVESDRILFASEIKQILKASSPGINASYLYEYLHGHRGHFTDETYYQGVYSVPAASFVEIDLDAPTRPDLNFRTWWDLSRLSKAPKRPAAPEEAQHELENLLRASVKLHIRARVKVGSLVSGGLDSTMLTELMRQSSDKSHESYSLVFDRSRYAEFDESNYVDDYVRQSNVKNFRTTFDPNWIRDNIRNVTWIQDEPLIASTIFAQHRAFQLARERGATVVLDGQGSDEVFGGYPHHEFTVWRERLMRGQLSAFPRESKILANHSHTTVPRLLYFQMARVPAGTIVRRFRLWYGRYAWLDEKYFRPFRRGAPPEEIARRREVASWRSHLDRDMYADIRYVGLPSLFLYSDRNGMAHSIEARLPYLDHHLVEFAMQLPSEMKAGFGVRKKLLRNLAKRYLPDSITGRTDKMGFATPEMLWLRKDLSEAVTEAVESPVMARVPFIRKTQAREFVRSYVEGKHRDFRAVWRLYALRHWLEVFNLA